MRNWVIVGIVTVLVVVGSIAAFGSGGGGGGTKPLLITTSVKRRDLQDKVTVTGTLGRVEQRSINAVSNSTVSKVTVADGATMEAGLPVLALDGRNSVTENGDVSFFRKLDVGASGADVLQLEQILAASGYAPGTVDQVYTEQTRSALGQWQGAHGYPSSAPQAQQSVTVSLQPGSGYKVGKQSSAGVVIGPHGPTAVKASYRAPHGAGTGAAKGVLASYPSSVHHLPPCTPAPANPRIAITISGATSIAEGGSTTITVTAEDILSCPTEVTLSVSGSATPGADYSVFSPTLIVPAGAAGISASFPLGTLNDTVAEPDEFAVISIVPSSGAYTIGSTGSATVTITDPGGTQPVVTLTQSTARVPEGQPAQFNVGLDRPLTTSLQVFLSFGGDAVEGSDYSRPAGLLVFPPGQTAAAVVVPTLDDTVVEPDHMLTVSLATSAGYQIGDPSSAALTIVSEDVPEIQIVGGSSNLGKGGAAQFRIVADQAPLVNTSVQYSATGTAKPGIDIAPLTGTVLLRAGTTSAAVSVFALNTDVVFLPSDMIVAHWPTRVSKTFVKEGDIVAPGVPLFTITDTGFTVTLKASASDRTKLKVGQQVTVTLQGGTTSAPGVITVLDENATIDPDTKQQTYEGTVEVQGDLGAADGAPVTIDVIIEDHPGVLTVPIAAVKQNGAGQAVVRVLDLKQRGRITERPVKTGLSEGSYIEITSGLKGNELVVVEVDQGSG